MQMGKADARRRREPASSMLNLLYSCAMTQNARTVSQRRMGKFPGAAIAMLAVLPILVVGSASITHAATIPVSFEFDNLLLIAGAPSPANPSVPTVLSGTGIFNPFG